MKPIQRIFALTVGIMMMLGALQAQAATVITDADNNVLRINNLELDLDQDALDGFFNVEFVNDTGFNVYGNSLTFDFPNSENAATARLQVQNVLNGEIPVPTGASAAGTDQFFIGADFENNFIAALGANTSPVAENGVIA